METNMIELAGAIGRTKNTHSYRNTISGIQNLDEKHSKGPLSGFHLVLRLEICEDMKGKHPFQGTVIGGVTTFGG